VANVFTLTDEVFGVEDRPQFERADVEFKLEKEVFTSPAFREFASGFVLLRVDTEDGGEGSSLQEAYGAYSLPTTLVLEPSGVMVADIQGFAPAAPYIASIKQGIETYEELVRGYEKFGESEDLRVLAVLADEFSRRKDVERAAELYRRMLATEQVSVEQAMALRYQLAETLRLGEAYEQAIEQVQQARVLATREGNSTLLERLELLTAQIALDRGDCESAENALEEFLGSHPESQFSRSARKTLKVLRSDGFACM
jgi:tetratricopeptide (TPR) repeat protein